MKKYFEQLRPMERRLAVAVIVAVILVFNYIVIWPHFSDWGNLDNQISAGQQKLKNYQDAIAQTSAKVSRIALVGPGGLLPETAPYAKLCESIDPHPRRRPISPEDGPPAPMTPREPPVASNSCSR